TITGFTDCEAIGEVQVAITDGPSTPVLSLADETICEGQEIILSVPPVSGGGDVTYMWFDGNGLPIDTTISPTFVIDASLAPGQYCFTAMTNRDGCDSGFSNEVCATVVETPVAETFDDNIDICEGGTVQLGTFVEGPDITYLWEGPDGYVSTLQIPEAIEDITQIQGGIYSLTVFRLGCPSSVDITVVNVLDRPDQPIITNGTSPLNPACEGDSITLLTNIEGATAYEWSGGNGLLNFVTDVPMLTIDIGIIGVHDGEWTVIALDNICVSDAAEVTTVYIEALPIVTATSNEPVCANETLILQVNETPGSTYEWSGPNSFVGVGSMETLEDPIPGDYSVTVTSPGGCKTSDTINVIVNDFPIITSISSTAIPCPAGPTDITLSADISPAMGEYEYSWSNSVLGFSSDDEEPLIADATQLDNGTYTLVVENEFGCISDPETVDVNMGPILPTPTTPVLGLPNPYCVGEEVQLSSIDQYSGTDEVFYWITPNNGTITNSQPQLTVSDLNTSSSGAYSVYAEIDGCFTDTSNAVFVVVNPVPEAQAFTNSPVCAGESLNLFFDDCTPSLDVSYSWIGPTGSNFSSSVCNPTIDPVDPDVHDGVYIATLFVEGCPSNPIEIDVTVNELPQVPAITSNSPVCQEGGDPLIISIDPNTTTSGATYTWYYEGDSLTSGMGLSVLSLNDLSDFPAGANAFSVVTVSGSTGCVSAFSTDVIVQIDTFPPNNADAGEDIQICEGQIAELTASQPSIGTGLWTISPNNPPGAEITNQDMAVTTVQGLIPGETYEFIWTLSNGACVNYSVDTVEVLVDILETAEAGTPFDTCAVTSVLLGAIQPAVGDGFWSQPAPQEALGVMIGDINDPNTPITGLVPGNEYIFTWTLPDNGCGETQDVVTVTIIDEFAFAGDDYFDCGDGCTSLAALRPDAGFGSWSSPDPNITFFNIDEPDAIACNLSPGPNTLVWTLNDGSCGVNGTDEVIVEYKIAPMAENDQIDLDFASQVEVNVVANDLKPDDFFVNILLPPDQGTVTALENGWFNYTADVNYIGEDQFSYELCSETCDCSTGTVFINIGEDARCVVPTIITPNNDGINDLFIIPCLADATAFQGNTVAIFNQWGDEVFRARDYQNNWGGTFDGELLPVGTYYFVVDFADGTDVQTGFLVIQQ
ncbi:MAG: gliding motility-associated C-terminal domain-containing protein, partial [Bacteroidota bacterium]